MAATAPSLSPGAAPGQTIVIYTQSTLSRLLGWLGWAGFVICGLVLLSFWSAFSDYFDTTGGIEREVRPGREDGQATRSPIISIEGVIMEGDGFVKQQIDRIREDDERQGRRRPRRFARRHGHRQRLHLSPPEEASRRERELPLVVSMGGMAASGGYYVSMAVGDQENVIFAEPTATTGSIGVIIPHYDVSGLMARFDVKDDSIATHERKQMLSMTRPMPEEHREIIQEHIDDMFVRFKSDHQGRPAHVSEGRAKPSTSWPPARSSPPTRRSSTA